MRRPYPGGRQRLPARSGYSLVEVLITLVIMGMITGLLFQGLGGAARLTLKLSDEADRLDRMALASDWWRDSVISALPAEVDPDAPKAPRTPTLVGAATTLSLVTATSLHARIGAPRQASWSLVPAGRDMTLIYEADGQRWLIARSRQPDARFSYRGPDGAWREAWSEPDPPGLVMLENFFDAPILAHPRSRATADQPSERVAVGL